MSDHDLLLEDDEINYELYNRWRDSLWSCPNAIRYPNKIYRKKLPKFALCIDKQGKETRMDYLTFRKQIYYKEYTRLIKKLSEYRILLNKLKAGKNIMICEVDVPRSWAYNMEINGIKLDYTQQMSIARLEQLINDTSMPFGHGLCLAYSLLLDLNHQTIPF